jgi:hypothetical protein
MAKAKRRKSGFLRKPRSRRNPGRPTGRPKESRNRGAPELYALIGMEAERIKAEHPDFSDARIAKEISKCGIRASSTLGERPPIKKGLPSAETIRKRLHAARREAFKQRLIHPPLPESPPAPAIDLSDAASGGLFGGMFAKLDKTD